MASIEHRARTTRVLAYINKEKIPFVLGCVSKKTAQRFANNIDALLNERRCSLPMSQEVAKWIAGLDDTLHELLSSRGLIEPRVKAARLANFIDEYIAGRTDVTARRVGKLNNARERMIEYFGDVELASISPGQADEYARWLLTKLAPATAQKECQIAAQFFRHAFRKRKIERNPFEGVTVGRAVNEERRVFVGRETKVLALYLCSRSCDRT